MKDCPFTKDCLAATSSCTREDLIRYCLPIFQIKKDEPCGICGVKQEKCYGFNGFGICKDCLVGFNFPRMAQQLGIDPKAAAEIASRF